MGPPGGVAGQHAEVRPPCPHYPDCVSCELVGTAYGEQLAAKLATLCMAIRAYPRLAELEIPPVIGSPRVFGYRNQAKLVARRARRGLLLGVYRPGTHQVVDISRCATHQPPINDVLAALRDVIERYEVPVYDERSRRGWLRYVILRASGFEKSTQVILVVAHRKYRKEKLVLQHVRRIRRVRSVVLNVNDTRGNVILGERYLQVTRETSLVERIGSLRIKSRAGSFLQANIPVARRIYQTVLEWAAPRRQEVAVDLYCGVGTISLSLATRARFVWGVEASPRAVLDAKLNQRLNGFHNVRFIEGKASSSLTQITRECGTIDIVSLNPPRKGTDEATRTAILEAAPSRVIYVSCDPQTLVRDLDWFVARGYKIDRIQPFDLLPQTPHVECAVKLVRLAPASDVPMIDRAAVTQPTSAPIPSKAFSSVPDS